MSDYIDQEHKIITKNRHLNRRWEEFYEKKVALELELALNIGRDPNEITGKKPLAVAPNGQPLSYKDITRAEYVALRSEELQRVDETLKTIESLFEEEPENTNAIKE